MPTSTYLGAQGERLPSVTQIIGSTWNKGDALIAWANREGLAGRLHTAARDAAALTGTIAHALVLARMGGPVLDMTGYNPRNLLAGRIPAHHGLTWLAQHVVEATLCEQPMVSAAMGYGGTPDWYGLLDGVPTLLDIKTSTGVYPEHVIQLAAYRALLIEAGYAVEQAGILHLPRTLSGHPRLHITGGERLALAGDAWGLCLQMFSVKQALEHRE